MELQPMHKAEAAARNRMRILRGPGRNGSTGYMLLKVIPPGQRQAADAVPILQTQADIGIPAQGRARFATRIALPLPIAGQRPERFGLAQEGEMLAEG